jgi:hypothetical protein
MLMAPNTSGELHDHVHEKRHTCPSGKSPCKPMYYVVAEVRATEDYRTKQITVRGLLGIAPDEHTVIEYPVCIYRFGYWNRTNTRKIMREVKAELLEKSAALGYWRESFTQPLEMRDPWTR